MLNHTFAYLVNSVFFFAALVWAIEQVKKIFITNSITVSRMTQDGETVAVHANFTVFDSYEVKRAKLFELAQLGDDRLRFCDDKFKAHLEAEIAKQRKS